MATDGGPLITIGDYDLPFGVSWRVDNKILLGGRAIWQQSAEGGKAEQLIGLDAGSLAERPQLLAGGPWILFTLIPAGAASFDDGLVVVQSRTSGERHVIVKGARDALYLPSGHLVFGRGHTLLAQAFDINRLTVAGSPVEIVDDVANGGAATPIMQFAVSATGTLARPYGPGEEIMISVGGGGEPVWAPSGRELFYRRDKKMMVVPVDTSGAPLKIGTPRVLFDAPYMPMLDAPASGGVANYDISPDGQHFVMVELSGLSGRGSDTVRVQMVLNWIEELRQRGPTH